MELPDRSACSNLKQESETETIDLEQNGLFLKEFCKTDGEFDLSYQTMTSRSYINWICVFRQVELWPQIELNDL